LRDIKAPFLAYSSSASSPAISQTPIPSSSSAWSSLGSLGETLNQSILQQFTSPAKNSSPSLGMVDQCGSSVKSSATYTYRKSTLDSKLVPSRGSNFELALEVAGLGGDVQYLRSQVQGKRYYSLTPSISLGLSAQAGMLLPTNAISGNPRTGIADRFFLGGPLTLRGYKNNTVGPTDIAPDQTKDSLGGDVYGRCGVEIIKELPAKWCLLSPSYLHTFLNCGNLLGWSSLLDKEARSQALKEIKCSAGIGIVAPTPLGRLELNFVAPLNSTPTDSIQHFQFGLGFNFH